MAKKKNQPEPRGGGFGAPPGGVGSGGRGCWGAAIIVCFSLKSNKTKQNKAKKNKNKNKKQNQKHLLNLNFKTQNKHLET